MLIDKPTNIKIVKEHLNDGITLKELKEKYGISNDRTKYMIALYNRYGKETVSLPKGNKEDNETIIETAIRECYEEMNIIVSKDDLIKELASYSYEFLTPSNKLIRKTIVPFLFEVKEEGNPIPKEERIISVQWMDTNEFLDKCTHENVKEILKRI